MHGAMQLLQFFIYIRSGSGVADVGVDLAEKRHTDTHRFQIAVINIGGNDGAAARHFVAHQFRRKFFALGDVLHLFGHDAQARVVHLREISHAAIHRRGALFDPCIPHRHKTPVNTNPETAIPPNAALLHRVGCTATCEGGVRSRSDYGAAVEAATSPSNASSFAGSDTGGWQVVSTHTSACGFAASRCGIVSRSAGASEAAANVSGVTRSTALPKR